MSDAPLASSAPPRTGFFAAPLWLVGFRPFFALACLTGATLPLTWVAILSGAFPAPRVPFSIVQWHAHEMFYGFGWAVLGGFLLTSTKNWVGVRGWHGAPLALLASAWLVERGGMWFARELPPWLFRVSNNVFLASAVVMLLATLLLHREKDTFKDNVIFIAVLPVFLGAKWLLLSTDHQALGVSMTLGLFRVAFLVMLERTLTQFIKGGFQVQLPRHLALDGAIKALGVALVFEGFAAPLLSAAAALLLATLLLVRFAIWKPQLGFRRLELAVMYLGYLGLVGQLVLEFGGRLVPHAWAGTLPLHVFTLGTMGLIIPAMVVRLARGHTGRKVEFDRGDRAVLWVMLAAFGFRVVATQFDAEGYQRWLTAAAACWALGFGTLLLRYLPFLARPRVDGKEH